MSSPDYSTLVNSQREYFVSGCTRSSSWRKAQLETLKAMFTENREELCGALGKDLRRNVVDADLMDVAYIVKEADYALEHLDKWLAPEKVHMPLAFEPGHVRVRRDPLADAKRKGLATYGQFAQNYVEDFELKWPVHDPAPADDLLELPTFSR